MGQDSPINIAADRYQIEGEIGRGGMGVVLKAHDRVLNILVAIKVLGNDPTGMGAARLQREATAAGKLSHPNIARIFDFGQTSDSTPYMVMEYLEGQSLSDLIKQESRLDCRKAVPIFAQIASALSYAHSNGVIHRDLKPSNVMLIDPGTKACQAKLLDFGVARIYSDDQSLTRTGAIIGSPLYMSPEQTQGDEATESSDIYSFGCLMFECLTGQPPFRGLSALETMSMHRNMAPPLLTDLISIQKLPNELVTLVDECLHKIPQNRPENFEAILGRLKAIEDKLENRVLTFEQIQRISNQHFKIRLHQFWKSKFGGISVLASLVVLAGLALSMNQSEQKRITESKLAPKTVLPDTTMKDIFTIKAPISDDFKYQVLNGSAIISSNDTATDDGLIKFKGKSVNRAILEHGSLNGSCLQYLDPDNLTTISMLPSRVIDSNLKYLRPMHTLHFFNVGSKYLSDEGVKEIAKVKSLRELFLKSDLITDKGIEYLTALPDLDHLRIEGSGVTDGVVRSLEKMKKLSRLHLVRTSISPDIGVKLANLDHLLSLEITGKKNISENSFEVLSKSKLQVLHLSDCDLNEDSFRAIGKIKELNRLILKNTRFNHMNIKYLRNMPNLTRLELDESKNISDSLINEVSELNQLKVLSLSDTNISEAQFLKLTKMRHLDEIQIFDTQISTETRILFADTYARIWKRPCLINGSERDSDL